MLVASALKVIDMDIVQPTECLLYVSQTCSFVIVIIINLLGIERDVPCIWQRWQWSHWLWWVSNCPQSKFTKLTHLTSMTQKFCIYFQNCGNKKHYETECNRNTTYVALIRKSIITISNKIIIYFDVISYAFCMM